MNVAQTVTKLDFGGAQNRCAAVLNQGGPSTHNSELVPISSSRGEGCRGEGSAVAGVESKGVSEKRV